MPTTLAVSLVIPILNETSSLPELLTAIKAQTIRPAEIIFTDAGSTDGSRELIEAWWKAEGWSEASCKVLLKPGALPGAGRNAGIRAATSEWIAFLDGGIEPDPNWLEMLCHYASQHHTEAVFGVCHFSASSAFAKSVCALSYGYGAVHPVIPASLFKRTVFDKIGYFPERLRAGEDIVWVQRLVEYFGERNVCDHAVVRYTHFPERWRSAVGKWHVTEYHCLIAGVRSSQQFAYLIGLPFLYGALVHGTIYGIGAFAIYFAARGIADPMRRSKSHPWWGNKPTAFLIAPILAAALDLAKWTGIVRGIVWKTCMLTGQTK